MTVDPYAVLVLLAIGLAAVLYLPLMQSVTLMVWLWFLLGLGVESGRISRSWQHAPAPTKT